jgi:hypothetical protein
MVILEKSLLIFLFFLKDIGYGLRPRSYRGRTENF